jgi:PEP-CTERM motif
LKTLLLIILTLTLSLEAYGQGTLNVLNNLANSFRAPIYSATPSDPYLTLSGQSSLGIPSGPVVYPGHLLAGTGFTFAVYYGAATVTDPGLLSLLITAPFRTATGDNLPAGLIATIPDVPVPGVAPGERAMLQVRVWDNWGGLFSSYLQAISVDAPHGTSSMFLSQPLGGGTLFSPDMTGWTSFNIYITPEPSPLLLAGLGALTFVFWRWRFHGSR